MADCCSPGTNFPNASSMQQMATNWPIVWEEICAIQQAILAASSQCQPGGGQMAVTVGGTTPMTFITGIDSVDVVNGGSGYYQDSPTVLFVPPLGSLGAGATANVVTNGSNILAINMVTNGINYQPVPATINVSSLAGFGAILEPLVNSYGEILGINIVNGGAGYTLDDTVTATRAVAPSPYYIDAQFKITEVGTVGEIISVAILFPGTGYQDSVTEVKIVSSLDSNLDYPLGSGFYGMALVDNTGAITGVSIINNGAGYDVFPPYLVISDPGSNAKTSVNLTGTAVGSVDVLNSGNNYTQSATGTIMNPPTAALPNPPSSAAVVQINVRENTYGTNPTLYWQVWAGAATNIQISTQLNAVLSYFKGLNYTILIQSNPTTNNTIQWYLTW